MVANNLKKHDPELGNHERVKRLLDSLPPEWSSHGKSIRRERGFTDYKLVEVMDILKSFDDKDEKNDEGKKEAEDEEMLKAKEEINHALIAETVEESAHDNNYIDCFDPFKEFYGDDGENSDEVVDELKVVRDEEDRDGLVCEADDKKEMRVFATVDHEVKNADNAEESKLNMEAMIKKAKLEAVDKFKRSTPYCQCDRALAAEKLV
ncbi:hypothetical protein QVD17_38150 [Tagetes erecta]|uniref:Uncharacterized protein n=1 Tax=Tagetes erecta TaxID=13708 RepID=A0AAD8K1V3_TARER|nr:hypothetical protein QVD17_38150 [Tagetes erecta]